MTTMNRPWLFLLPAILLGCDVGEGPEPLVVVDAPQTEDELLGAAHPNNLWVV
jgi:hypothetical protein